MLSVYNSHGVETFLHNLANAAEIYLQFSSMKAFFWRHTPQGFALLFYAHVKGRSEDLWSQT